jgi:hypothetical protein
VREEEKGKREEKEDGKKRRMIGDDDMGRKRTGDRWRLRKEQKKGARR